MMDRAEIVHEKFVACVKSGDLPAKIGDICLTDTDLSKEGLVGLFRSQVISRQLDRVSRKMQARGEGFYTIGSSGHEGMAAIAMAFKPTDMAFLHYRDAAFQIERSNQVVGQSPLWDMLLSFSASSEDPISGGRHKVLGSKQLFIPPQTSTIGSHLPKAIGAAYSIDLAERLSLEHRQMHGNSVVLCSFGDASLNHSTAQGALNTAAWTAYQHLPLPLVFICEDNGIGISTRTPGGWVEATTANRPGLRYFRCSGFDILETYAKSCEVAQWTRRHRRPAFLHMSCVRLYGHAGADVQSAYMSKAQIESDEANDPLLHSARILIDEGVLSRSEILDIYREVSTRTERVAAEAASRPRLSSARDVSKSLIPPRRLCTKTNAPSADAREQTFGESDMRAMDQPHHMAKLINLALTDLMLTFPEIVLAGQDIGPKGGVYGVTQRLHQRFGSSRVINTLLDEQAILGLAIGMAHNGFLPIPEIQFLAYLHNAEDQIRGEAATLSFFSNGQFTNPMVLRVAGLAYQHGFGGHFHNDNSLAVLRDIPGVIIACPSNGLDAVSMLRECVRLAREEQRIVVFVEPIALYMTKDLHQKGDGLWAHAYPVPGAKKPIVLGEVGVRYSGTDLAIVTYGNGFHLSCQAEKSLREDHNVAVRIVDMRWLAPAPNHSLLEAISPCSNILIVDECRVTGSQSDALMTLFTQNTSTAVDRYAAEDCFIATGPAYATSLPSREGIIEAALRLLYKSNSKGKS